MNTPTDRLLPLIERLLSDRRLPLLVLLLIGAVWLLRRGIQGAIQIVFSLFGLGMAWYWSGAGFLHWFF
jgi:hypothetical protein